MGAGESRELMVLDRRSGEVLDVLTAPTDQLAGFLTNLADLRTELAEAERLVHAELLGRMDKELKWTHRLPVRDDAQVELTAPSPTAGTVSYDPHVLEKHLLPLVKQGKLSEAALEEVVPRTVAITARGRETARLEKYADKAGAEVKASIKSTAAGVAKLRKLEDPAIDCAIEEAKVTTPVAGRRVAVKVIEKEAAKRR